MRNSLFLALVFLLTPVALIAASPIQNLIDVPVPIRVDGGGYSIEEVRAAIIKASQTGLWTAEIAADNAIRAHLNVKNKHFAVVEIPYSETAYSIMYVSSDNLDYNAKWQSIHRNYNKWVLQLSTSIKEQFQALEASDVPNVSACDEPNMNKESIFDELLKLDDLRDQGILTDEEFETEKRKLLERS
jgi:hypothetical protein